MFTAIVLLVTVRDLQVIRDTVKLVIVGAVAEPVGVTVVMTSGALG